MSMKSGAFWILLIITLVLLGYLGLKFYERMLAARYHVGETIIKLPDGGPTWLSDDVVIKLVTYALISNSITVSDWGFVSSLQNSNSLVTRNTVASNYVSVMLTNANPNRTPNSISKLIGSVEFTNGTARIHLRRPK